jgi:hypothetical protein
MAAKKTAASRARRSLHARARPKSKRWSSKVTKTSNALDLETGVFKLKSPRALARSLKQSAERSSRRKSTPFRSAMSMLNFEINRGGKNLSPERKRVLNAAKQELRKLFRRPAE